MIMKKGEQALVFMGDFETTVYEHQQFTEVWASALVPLYTEDVTIFHSIDDTFSFLLSLGRSVTVYYHNLKFDGSFWLDFLIKKTGYTQAIEKVDGVYRWRKKKAMLPGSFRYSVSNDGQWYEIIIKTPDGYITLRDSLKLLPFSVKRIGESFGTKHKKLDMEYKGFRYAGCEITEKEREYIANDVLVVKEALEIMFDEGHTKLTIGACCLSEFRKGFDHWELKTMFPNMYDIPIDQKAYGAPTAGDYIRKSYRGGWCYLAKGKENRVYTQGTTCDVNSLYPSMMHSESGNRYPIGKPHFWQGNYIPDAAEDENRFFFIRIRTRFRLKPGFLPFIQLKGQMLYRPNEMLETSDYISKQDGKPYRYYRTPDGKKHDTRVTLTLTMTDFQLLQKNYYLSSFEVLDGCWFYAMTGLFDPYIDKYKKIKLESKGAVRELAKLFLNNLYGKLAANTDSSFKLAYLDDDGIVHFGIVNENEKDPGYIPIGSAITAYARRFTITAAQANYYGPDRPGFIYADTDSIHCDLLPDQIKGAPRDDVAFCHWKYESSWDFALFVRQKTYIEHAVAENLKTCEPFYNLKCAGMPERSKNLFLWSVFQDAPEGEALSADEQIFIKEKRELTDFKIGLKIPGKLLPKQIPGGTVLTETTYEMR